jgi:hypothetical protein
MICEESQRFSMGTHGRSIYKVNLDQVQQLMIKIMGKHVFKQIQ